MASRVSRYKSDVSIKRGTMKSTAKAIRRIRLAKRAGKIPCRTISLKEDERLDKLAGQLFGDGRLWWVLAALSDIGWGLQLPPGTKISVPLNVGSVMGYV